MNTFIAFPTVLEAIERGVAETGDSSPLSFDGDFGHDEGKGQFGMGNDSFSIVVWPNGTARLSYKPTLTRDTAIQLAVSRVMEVYRPHMNDDQVNISINSVGTQEVFVTAGIDGFDASYTSSVSIGNEGKQWVVTEAEENELPEPETVGFTEANSCNLTESEKAMHPIRRQALMYGYSSTCSDEFVMYENIANRFTLLALLIENQERMSSRYSIAHHDVYGTHHYVIIYHITEGPHKGDHVVGFIGKVSGDFGYSGFVHVGG